MSSSKKYLILGVVLNCLFFLGSAAFLAQKSKDMGEFSKFLPLAEGVKLVLEDLTRERQTVSELINTIPAASDVDAQKKAFSQLSFLSQAIYFDGTKGHALVKSQIPSWPFPDTLLKSPMTGFFKFKEKFYVTYILIPASNPAARYIVSVEKSLEDLAYKLKWANVDFAILDQDGAQRIVIASTLNEDFLKKIKEEYDAGALATDNPYDKSNLFSAISEFTYLGEKFILIPWQGIADKNIHQRFLFLQKQMDYRVITPTQLYFYILALFCISLMLTFYIYQKAKKS